MLYIVIAELIKKDNKLILLINIYSSYNLFVPNI